MSCLVWYQPVQIPQKFSVALTPHHSFFSFIAACIMILVIVAVTSPVAPLATTHLLQFSFVAICCLQTMVVAIQCFEKCDEAVRLRARILCVSLVIVVPALYTISTYCLEYEKDKAKVANSSGDLWQPWFVVASQHLTPFVAVTAIIVGFHLGMSFYALFCLSKGSTKEQGLPPPNQASWIWSSSNPKMSKEASGRSSRLVKHRSGH